MDLLNNSPILQEIPLFATLSSEELNFIQEKCSFIEYKKGQVIYQEGSPADAFYCVILGRVVIYTRGHDGNAAILEYLHRGKYFGIISLLTGDSHSVSAKAINDCLLLVVKKEDFDLILNKIPRLAIDLSRTLSRRLKRKDLHQKTIFESTVISVFSSYSQAGKTIYALNLALSLKQETHKSVLILDIAPADKTYSLPQHLGVGTLPKVIDLSSCVDNIGLVKDYLLENKFGVDLVCLSYKPDDDSRTKRLVNILSLLVTDYHYIILDLPAQVDEYIFGMLNQSDLIHIISGPDIVDLEKTQHLIDQLDADFHFPESKVKVIINEYKLSLYTHDQQREVLKRDIFATLPKIESSTSDRLVLDAPGCEYSRSVRRISRSVGDRLVGLALGVGVAYGFCHIGVLKVIEEEKIPIDVVVGSSTGALMAALWATGRSSQEILAVTKEFKEPKYIWSIIDLTFPWLGFIKGNKLYGFLKKYLGNMTFYDVKLPLKIVASDVKRKEPIIFENGLLVDALMASCAMPGVFLPFKNKEDMFFDGGIINPVPTEVLFRMGLRKIIAVNVTPSREDIIKQYEKMKQGLDSTDKKTSPKKGFSLKEYFKAKFNNNILDIIFSSIEMMQSEMAQKEGLLADVVLHPDTSGLYWLELHRAEEFMKRGEEEARRNLDKIWQVVNE